MTANLEQSHKVKIVLFDNLTNWVDSKTFTITYQMFSVSSDDDVEIQSMNQNAAFLKINYFIKNMLDGSIAYTMDNMNMVQRFLSEYENNFMVLPNLDDVTILEALHSKLSTLAGDTTFITKLSMHDENLDLTYNYYHDDETTYLLPTIDEWLGELSFWDKPWWERYDVLTFDNVAESVEERDEHRNNSEPRDAVVEPLNDIDDDVKKMLSRLKKKLSDEDEEKPEGKLISLDSARKKKSKWKPTVI